MNARVQKVESVTAALLAAAGLWLHAVAATSAGALWRDEANTVAIATLPGLTDVWKNLQFDSFPILWLLVVRIFSRIAGPLNDPALRSLGLVVGVALIVALWINARAFGNRYPLMALALVALSPTVVRWGDSMRAYGLGMVLIVLAMSSIWKYVESPSIKRFGPAAIIAILSVHTLYYNSVLLLAIVAAAIAVCVRRRDTKTALNVFGIGTVAALSLIPYLSALRAAAAWNAMVRVDSYSAEWFWVKLFEAVSPAGGLIFVVWILLIAFSGGFALVALRWPRLLGASDSQQERILFALVMMVVGAVGSFVFLKALSYYTQPWYYLTLLVVTGVSLDVLVGTLATSMASRIILALTALAIGGATTFAAPSHLHARMTNVNLVSHRLESLATTADLIILNPWYNGVSFSRYYQGRAEWITSPSIGFHDFHRYDLVQSLVSRGADEAISPVIERATSALSSGATVYVVGNFPDSTANGAMSRNSFSPPALRESYQPRWDSLLSKVFHDHAITINSVPVASPLGVSRYESMTVTAVRGWRP